MLSAGVAHGVLIHRGIMCSEENADEKELLEHVLWYHPVTDSNRRRLERLSVVESLLAFAANFGGPQAVDSVLLSSSRYVFLEVERELWLVWLVGREAEPVAVQSLMAQSYDAWFLSHGRILDLFDQAGLAAVGELAAARKRARKARQQGETINDEVDDSACPTTKIRERLSQVIATIGDATKASSLDDMVGFEHCGAEPLIFLSAHRVHREVSSSLPVVATAIIWRESILWSSFDFGLVLPFYARLLRSLGERQASGFVPPEENSTLQHPFWRVHLGANRDTPHCLDATNWGRATRRDAPSAQPAEPTAVLVYALADVAIILFFRAIDGLDLNDIEMRLDSALGPLANDLKLRGPKRRGSPVDGCDFVYFNRSNASLKLAFVAPLPAFALKAMDDARLAFLRYPPQLHEVAIPFPNQSGWLVAKKNDRRLLFILLDSRYADFTLAQDALLGLRAGLLSNILVLPP